MVNEQKTYVGLFIALVSLTAPGCDDEEFDDRESIDVVDDDVPSSDVDGDAPAAAEAFIPDVKIGSTIWEYVGQQPERGPHQARRSWHMESPDDVLDTERDVESLLRDTTRVDSEGRVWAFKALDHDDLQKKLDDNYDAQLEAGFAPEELNSPELGLAAETAPLPDEDDRWGTPWLPMSWSSQTCVNNPWPTPDVKLARWDADSRMQVNKATLTGRSSGAVIVATRNPTTNTIAASCSGVMVGDSWVLTAAHCVANDSGNEEPTSFIAVAAGGGDHPSANVSPMYTNFDGWHGVEAIHIPSQYNGSNFNRDYALLHLTSPISPNLAKQMRFSGASDSSWEDSTPHNVSYPGFGPGCASNVFPGSAVFGTSSGNQTVTEVRQRAFQQLLVDGVNFVSGNKIGTNLDSVGGQSGSPIYRCGGGTCQTGETGWIMGVLVGRFYQNARWHHGGPNANQFRSWALALIDD